MSSIDNRDAQQRALAAKLSMPHQGFVLKRPRLLARIERLREGGVVSVVAGPGYGKTALIVDLLRNLDVRTVYYAVDDTDTDPVRFLHYLIAGLTTPERSLSAGWGTDFTPPSDDLTALDLAAVLIDHVRAQAQLPTILALDDLHHVDSIPEVADALTLIIRSLPPRWTALLTSRRRLALNVDEVSLGGRLVRLQGRDLRLTPREVAAWARQNWDVGLEPSEARALWRLTEGWPAVLALLGQHLLSSGSGISRRGVMEVMTHGRELRAYLEKHVISDLEPLAAETILTASLLPRVVLPRDEEFLPGAPGAAEAALTEFVSRGFLITATGRRSFTLHPLLRGYAERELWPREAQTGLIRRAAEHLEKQAEHREAAYLFLRAGYFEEAARPLRALALTALNALVDFAPREWAHLIPDPPPVDQPWLMVAKAKALQQETRYVEAAALYERAARLLSHQRDDEGLLAVLLASAFCLFHQGLWEESVGVFARCRNLAVSPGERVEVLLAEVGVLTSLCRWDEAVERLEEVLAIAPSHLRAALTPRVYVHRARLFYCMGQYAVAKQWAYRALEAREDGASIVKASILNGCAIIEYVTGHYSAAERYAAECLRMVEARGYTHLRLPALLTAAGVALATGEFRKGLVDARQVEQLAKEVGDSEEVFWVEDMLGDLCRRQRNPQKALEHHRRALDIVEQNRLSLSQRAQACTAIGLDLVALGEEEQGRATLQETVGVCRRLGLSASLVPALLYLGWLDARAGREAEAGRALSEAIRLAATHQHVHFFVQEAQVALPILALCDRFDTGPFILTQVLPLLSPRLRRYFHRLTDGQIYPTDVELGPPRVVTLTPPATGSRVRGGRQTIPDPLVGIDALTEREREVLDMITQGMPNKVIGAKLFITEKTVKTHANHIFKKLGVSSRIQATLAFQEYQREKRKKPRGSRPSAPAR